MFKHVQGLIPRLHEYTLKIHPKITTLKLKIKIMGQKWRFHLTNTPFERTKQRVNVDQVAK
jgi:hypothetical protein